jgi:2-methylisocitrate lyase-like PEP mutase family enzyme
VTSFTTSRSALALRALHKRPLLLPNAWDAASAVAIESVGATAIATTSAGISWACGVPDGERIGRERMLQALGEIIASVRVPVTADIESGYGTTPEAVALTADAVIAIGAAGINIEDSPGTGATLREPPIQAARIRAARAVADRAVTATAHKIGSGLRIRVGGAAKVTKIRRLTVPDVTQRR